MGVRFVAIKEKVWLINTKEAKVLVDWGYATEVKKTGIGTFKDEKGQVYSSMIHVKEKKP